MPAHHSNYRKEHLVKVCKCEHWFLKGEGMSCAAVGLSH